MSSTTPPEALRRIEECRNIQNPELDLSYCKLTKIPPEVVDLVWLEKLNLSVNKISEIENLDTLSNLLKLDFFGNSINEIKNLNKLFKLRHLNFSSNLISEIKNLDKLNSLTHLDFFRNEISKIKKLDKLSRLTHLYISSNQIGEIENLDNLSELTHLGLSLNQISEMKNLEKLSKLTYLELSRNQINEIRNLDNLSELTVLFLYQNKISSILSGLSIPLMEKIKEIDLSNNPIQGTTITDWKSPKAILGYLKSQKEDIQVTNYHLKVNIIGEGRIGKTQLFNFWKKRKKYKPNDEQTHGTLTTQYDLPGSEYKATIWDFGGQAYHHGFHHVFLRPNDFYLVLWRNKEGRKDYGYWLGTARNFSRPSQEEYTAPVVLVQNVWNETDDPETKTTHTADLIDFPDSQKMAKYKVKLDNVFAIDVNYLHQRNLLWKDRHEYFMRSLHRMMEAHTKKLLPTISQKWLTVKEQLDKTPIEQINLTKAEFHEKHTPGFDEAALAGLLDYLEFTGNIIKFSEPSHLTEYVFPNPPFLADWIYNDVLSKEFKKSAGGIIEYEKLEKRVGPEKAKIFREIMEEFHLLFPEKEEENNLVIPQFLPENNNTFKRLLPDLIPYSFCLRFDDFFHESRIFQFISEYGEYADDKTSYWRYGLVFTIKEVNALVYYNQEERTVFVHLENKKGRIRIAQSIFDYFVLKQKVPLYKEEKLSYFAKKYSIGIDSLAEIATRNGFEIKPDPNAIVSFELNSVLAGELKWEDWHKELRRIAYGLREKNTRLRLEKLDFDDLIENDFIEGGQLSTNQKDYIDIKETLRNNTDDFPIGISVKSRKRIKLDHLTLNLLGMMTGKLPKVFISYSRKDLEFKNQLRTHLSILERYDLLKTWDCNEIKPGDWKSQIQTSLEKADIIVYMVSHNFMASDYIMEKEVKKGIQMVKDNPEKKIICVLTRPCMWQSWSFMEETFNNVIEQNGVGKFSDSMDLSKFQFLPYHGYRDNLGEVKSEEIVALEEWGTHPYGSRNVAYTQIVKQIMGEATRKK